MSYRVSVEEAISSVTVTPIATNGSLPEDLTVLNGQLIFTARSNCDNCTEKELWKTDGTEDGTVLIKDIADGMGLHRLPSVTAIMVYTTVFYI